IEGIPYLISQGIEGENLLDLVKKDPSLTSLDWDEESLFHTIVMAMITFPEDGFPRNYIVQKHPEKQRKRRLICVDNDQSFVPGIAKGGTKQKTEQNIVQVKCFPFCLPHMQKPIPQSIRQHYAKYEPYECLSELLKRLESYHTLL